jgi:hypothetical protein
MQAGFISLSMTELTVASRGSNEIGRTTIAFNPLHIVTPLLKIDAMANNKAQIIFTLPLALRAPSPISLTLPPVSHHVVDSRLQAKQPE